MRRVAIAAAAALVLTLGVGTASADTFAVVPDSPAAPLVLPSAETPNGFEPFQHFDRGGVIFGGEGGRAGKQIIGHSRAIPTVAFGWKRC